MAKTAVFHGRISAGIDCKLKIVIHVFTEQGAMGIPKGLLACNAPLGVVATATPKSDLHSNH